MRFILSSTVLALGGAGALGDSESLWTALALAGVVAAVVACLVQDIRELRAAS